MSKHVWNEDKSITIVQAINALMAAKPYYIAKNEQATEQFMQARSIESAFKHVKTQQLYTHTTRKYTLPSNKLKNNGIK